MNGSHKEDTLDRLHRNIHTHTHTRGLRRRVGPPAGEGKGLTPIGPQERITSGLQRSVCAKSATVALWPVLLKDLLAAARAFPCRQQSFINI